VRIAITLDKRLPLSSRTGDPKLQKGDLWYSLSNAANGLLIRPDSKRLMSMWKGGGEIQLLRDEQYKNFDNFGVVSYVRGQLVPLNLIVEVQNRSPGAIQVAGVSVDVDASASDLQPAIQMSEESAFNQSDFQDYYHPFYFIENFGWGAAKNAKLNFAFGPVGTPTKKGALARTQELGDIERSVKVDFEPHLQALGADLAALRRTGTDRFRCKSTTRPACLREVKAASLFGALKDLITLDEVSVIVGVAGTLDYEWVDSAGRSNKASSPFNIKVTLGSVMQEVEQGEGGARQIISRETQQLKLDATNYRLPISYKTSVPAGRTARLVVPLEADKSSAHDFKIAVQLADGQEIKSRPINLLYYRPRWLVPTVFETLPDDTRTNNYDLVGDDLRQVREKDMEPFACENACEGEPRCRAYAFDKWNKMCFLKGGADLKRFDAKFMFGLKEGTQQPPAASAANVVERYRDKAFPGYGYLIHQQSDFEGCEARCKSDDRCAAFTFKKNTQDCLLHDNPAAYSANKDADSGAKRQQAK